MRGLGLVCGVEIVSNKETKAADAAMTMKIFKAAQERGLRTRPLGNTLAFSPPLSITEDEVDEIIKRLGAAMDGVSCNPTPSPSPTCGEGSRAPNEK